MVHVKNLPFSSGTISISRIVPCGRGKSSLFNWSPHQPQTMTTNLPYQKPRQRHQTAGDDLLVERQHGTQLESGFPASRASTDAIERPPPAFGDNSTSTANGEMETRKTPGDSPLAYPIPPITDDSELSSLPPVYSIHSLQRQRFIVLLASISAFFSPLTAQIYLPALNVLSHEFAVSEADINLTVMTYMIFQGITPMFIGGFADTAGRRPAYVVCFVVYIAANIGLALSRNYASLLVVRCLQSAGSSTTVALCQAVVADVVTSSERGQFIAITTIPVMLGPSLGPVLGGVLTEYLGWRWIFWFLAIAAAANFVALLFFLPETCRRIVGDGSADAHPIYQTFWEMLRVRRRRSSSAYDAQAQAQTRERGGSGTKAPALRIGFPNPLSSLKLLAHKELFLLLSYSAVVFAGFYAIVTALPSQLASIYNFDTLQIGLMYLPAAGGSVLAALALGPAIDFNYRRHASRLGLGKVDRTRQADLSEFPIERARLEVGLPLMALAVGVIVAWGWAIKAVAPVAVLCVLQFLIGTILVGFNNAVNVLIVDIYPSQAGAAVAANNLTRCLVGAGATAVIVPMIDGMGAGGAYTLIAGLYVIFSPMLWLVMTRGMRWRAEMRVKEETDEEEKSAIEGQL